VKSAVTYVLPLRWTSEGGIAELAGYLQGIGRQVEEVIVVDGSPPRRFERHSSALDGIARHIPPDPAFDFAMGKVNGVMTGVGEAHHPVLILADDDVRYGRHELGAVAELLADADLVRPQNYFRDLPWHARWDTARSLLNRVFTGDPAFPVGDFPGTLAVRREALLAAGGYDGDALFENLELIRTIRARGGTVVTPLGLYVARLAPSASHFFSQRVRQAYDDFAIPLRIGFFLTLAPLMALALAQRRGRALGWTVSEFPRHPGPQ
jgi:hypothetical protein